MEQRHVAHLHEACLVPYRLTSAGVEFCLVSGQGENRWEFPKAGLDREDAPISQPLSDVALTTGIWGETFVDDPLGEFSATRGSESRTVRAYLMQVTRTQPDWPRQVTHRRLWCLAEEARIRIRRKPLRRFIDLALRQVEARVTSSGHALNGHAHVG